jgi:hypothetical protein
MALSNDRAISNIAKTPPIIRNSKRPERVPVVIHPNQPERIKPATVTITGHF